MKLFISAAMVGSILFSGVSSAETIDNIEITSITKTKIDTGNKQIIEESAGAVVGAGLSWAIAHYATEYSNTSKAIIATGGAMAGAYIANKVGDNKMEDGVKIEYMQNKSLQHIDVIGNPSDFHTGSAYLIIDDKGNKKIHQNKNIIEKKIS